MRAQLKPMYLKLSESARGSLLNRVYEGKQEFIDIVFDLAMDPGCKPKDEALFMEMWSTFSEILIEASCDEKLMEIVKNQPTGPNGGPFDVEEVA